LVDIWKLGAGIYSTALLETQGIVLFIGLLGAALMILGSITSGSGKK